MERVSLPGYTSFINLKHHATILLLGLVIYQRHSSFEDTQVEKQHKFHGGILDKIHKRDKLYKRIQLVKLHVYEKIYEEARKTVQNLIQKEENEEKLRKTRKRIKTLRNSWKY